MIEPTTLQSPDFDLRPDPRILPMLGEINLAQWKCIAELIDNSVDGFLEMKVGTGADEQHEVHVEIPLRDVPAAQVSVRDNGPGMSVDVLERAVRAGWSGNDPLGKLGLFGMGFNIATARLGGVTTVWTSRAGDTERVGLRIDFEQLRKQRHFKTPRLTQPKADPAQHGTEVTITNLKIEQRQWFAKPANRSKLQSELNKAYAAMLRPQGKPIQFKLTVGNIALAGRRHCVWGGPGNPPRVIQTPTKGAVDAFQPIDVKMEDRPFCTKCWNWLAADETACPSCGPDGRIAMRQRSVTGWLGIQRYLDETDYGIDFLRHGRKIEISSKELFFWQGPDGELNEPEYPIDDPRGRGRIVGEIHLDHCRVHYTKDRFDRTDPAWEEMRVLLRGPGPLRPDKANEAGFPDSDAPLYRLFQVFRRNNPKPKVAGAWKRLLVVPDNETAKEYSQKFHSGVPGYETDAKWWELVVEEDNKLLTPGAPPGGAGGAPPPGGGLPGFTGPNTPGPTGVPGPSGQPPAQPGLPYRAPIPSLSRTFRSNATGQKWQVQAFDVAPDHPNIAKKRPWALRALPNGVHEFYLDRINPIFASATMTPLDGLLGELSWSAMDFLRQDTHEHTYGSILADLREQYAKNAALDPATLAINAKQTLSNIASKVAKAIQSADANALFKALSADDRQLILTSMVSRGTANHQSVIGQGRFLEFAPPRAILRFFTAHPELFLDGNCWDDEYATLNFEEPSATELARSIAVKKYDGLLSDTVWLCEQEAADVAQESRPRVLRAMYALELLDASISDES
jgi:hypothetical protein